MLVSVKSHVSILFKQSRQHIGLVQQSFPVRPSLSNISHFQFLEKEVKKRSLLSLILQTIFFINACNMYAVDCLFVLEIKKEP